MKSVTTTKTNDTDKQALAKKTVMYETHVVRRTHSVTSKKSIFNDIVLFNNFSGLKNRKEIPEPVRSLRIQ